MMRWDIAQRKESLTRASCQDNVRFKFPEKQGAVQAYAVRLCCIPPLQELAGLLDGILFDSIDTRHCDICLSCQQCLHGMSRLVEYGDHLTAWSHS